MEHTLEIITLNNPLAWKQANGTSSADVLVTSLIVQ